MLVVLYTDDTETFTVNLSQTCSMNLTYTGSGSVSCIPNSCLYPSTCTCGQQITISATADSGWTFAGWTGDYSGMMNPVTLTLNGNANVNATFTQQSGGTLAWDPTRYTYDSRGFTVGNGNGDRVQWFYTVISDSPRIYRGTGGIETGMRFWVASNNIIPGGPAINEPVTIQLPISSYPLAFGCEGAYSPWYTEDGVNFTRASQSTYSNNLWSFTFALSSNYCEISVMFPWDYWMNLAYTDTFVGNPNAYVRNISMTDHQRETRLVELTNFSIPDSQKKQIAVIRGTHDGAESISVLVVKGWMDYIKNTGGDYLDKFHWYFVPTLDEDSEMGQPRSMCQGSGSTLCNYHWGDNQVSFINDIRTLLNAANGGLGMDCVFDMHSQGGSCGSTGILYITTHSPSVDIKNKLRALRSRYGDWGDLTPDCYGGGNNCSIWQYGYQNWHVNDGHCAGLASEVGQFSKSQTMQFIIDDGQYFAQALKNHFYP